MEGTVTVAEEIVREDAQGRTYVAAVAGDTITEADAKAIGIDAKGKDAGTPKDFEPTAAVPATPEPQTETAPAAPADPGFGGMNAKDAIKATGKLADADAVAAALASEKARPDGARSSVTDALDRRARQVEGGA